MNHFYSCFLNLALTSCVCAGTRAQGRKTELPVDSGILNTSQPIVPEAVPPKNEPFSPEKVFANPYRQPEYPGGTKALYRFIESNLKIHNQAREAGISGRVFTSFYIEVTGEITQVTVLKGLGYGCDEEAIRLVESMPRWKPGTVHTKPYRVKFNLPVTFMADKK